MGDGGDGGEGGGDDNDGVPKGLTIAGVRSLLTLVKRQVQNQGDGATRTQDQSSGMTTKAMIECVIRPGLSMGRFGLAWFGCSGTKML